MDIEGFPTKLLFHTTFRPILLLMKIFGLCPRIPQMSKPSANKRLTIFSFLYSIAVVLMIVFHIARTAPYLNFDKSFELYLRLNIVVWFLRNLAFSIYFIRLNASSEDKASRLEQVIRRLDDGIDGAQLKSNLKSTKKFKLKVKVMTWLIGTLIAMTCLFVGIAIVTQLGSGVIATALLLPFQNSLAFQIIYNFSNIFMVISWVVPMLLYSAICSSLVMKLSFLEKSMVSLYENSTLQHHIRTIRIMFLNVTGIVSKADDLFGPVALFIYFFDIVLFSVTLYGSLFIAKSAIEHINLSFWCFVAVINLLLVSVEAARVEEKVSVHYYHSKHTLRLIRNLTILVRFSIANDFKICKVILFFLEMC